MDIVEYDLESEPRGTSINEQMFAAIVNGDVAKLADTLRQGADPTYSGRFSMPAIVEAAFFEKDNKTSYDMVKLLLDNGANVNARNIPGATALHYAARRKNKELVVLLLERGADKRIRENDGSLATDTPTTPEIRELIAASQPPPVDLNKTLMDEILKGYWPGVHDALKRGANPNFVAADGRHVLVEAARFEVDLGAYNMVKSLLERGGNVNAQDATTRNTALHYAMLNNNWDLIVLLVNSRADTTLRNSNGTLPIDMTNNIRSRSLFTLGVNRLSAPRPAPTAAPRQAPRAVPATAPPPFFLPSLPRIPFPVTPTGTVPKVDKIYDVLMAEENTPLLDFVREHKDNAVIFHLKDQVFGTLRDKLRQSYEDKTAIRYECTGKKGIFVSPQDVRMDTPYYALITSFPIFIPLSEFRRILTSTHRHWKLTEKGKLPYTASRAMIGRPDGTNIDGEDLNAVSADHCQDGTDKPVFSVTPVTMSLSGGKRKTRKHKSKRRRTIRRR